MLQAIRTRVGGIIVKVLFGLLILSFGFWGIYTRSPFFQDKSTDAVVATVGDHDIPAGQVQTALQPALDRLRAQLGGAIDPAQAKQLGIVDAVLGQLVDRELLDQEIAHLHLDLSDDVIRSAVMSNPAFIGPDGKFNREQFNEVLGAKHLTEDGLIARLRQEIPRGDLLQALTAGVVVPRPVIDAIYRYRNETRIAEMVSVPLSAAANIAPPTDDQLTKFYNDHPDMFRAAEYRSFTVASLAAGDLEGGIKISDDQLKAAYQDHKEDFNVPEERDVQQILAPSEDKAKAVETALAGGEDFQKAATEIAGQDPSTVDLGLVKEDDLPKELAQPTFSLPLNKPSDPIKSELGWHIVRVVKIEPPKTMSFDDAKDQLDKQVIAEKAADQLDDIANKADDALAGGALSRRRRQKFGLKLTTIADTDASGRRPSRQTGHLAGRHGREVLKYGLLDTNANETSRITAIEDAGQGDFRRPSPSTRSPRPAVKPLARCVKDQAVAVWQAQEKCRTPSKRRAGRPRRCGQERHAARPSGLRQGPQRHHVDRSPLPRRAGPARPPVSAAIIPCNRSRRKSAIRSAPTTRLAPMSRSSGEIKAIPDADKPDDQVKALTTEASAVLHALRFGRRSSPTRSAEALPGHDPPPRRGGPVVLRKYRASSSGRNVKCWSEGSNRFFTIPRSGRRRLLPIIAMSWGSTSRSCTASRLNIALQPVLPRRGFQPASGEQNARPTGFQGTAPYAYFRE